LKSPFTDDALYGRALEEHRTKVTKHALPLGATHQKYERRQKRFASKLAKMEQSRNYPLQQNPDLPHSNMAASRFLSSFRFFLLHARWITVAAACLLRAKRALILS